MTSTNNNSKSEKSFLETLQLLSIPNLVAILGIFIYIPGCIIVNSYLIDYGVQDFSLFRIKYLSAGFVFIIIFTLYFIIVLQSIYYFDEKFDKILITLNPEKNSFFWIIFSTIRVIAEYALRHIVAVLVISTMFFPEKISHINVSMRFFITLTGVIFLIVTSRLSQKWPKTVYSISGIFYLSSPFLFFHYLETTVTFKLLLMFIGISTLYVSTLFITNKKIINFDKSDYFVILLFLILTSAFFGKLLYGDVKPEFGGGTQVPIKLIINKKNTPLFQEIPIVVNNNISEKVFLLLQTNNEYYIIKNKDSKYNNTEKSIQLSKKIIQGIIFVNEDDSKKQKK
jgi:hypothetical protein